MAINRRDFIKFSAGTGLMLTAGATSGQAARVTELSKDAVGILYDSTLCIGCKSCMVNCKRTNSEPGGALFHKETAGKVPYEYTEADKIYDAPQRLTDKTLLIIKGYQAEKQSSPGTGKSPAMHYISNHCMHCISPACVSACPVAALEKQKDSGIVTYNKNKCMGCRYCQLACPFGTPKYEWSKALPSIVKCQLCNHRYAQGKYSACCEFCPTGASVFGKVVDLRAEAKRRLALKPGDTYSYPVRRVDGTERTEQKAANYLNHVYGLEEAGGTQYLLLSGIEFVKLGLNPRIGKQAYPDYTWKFLSQVPLLVGGLLAAGAAARMVTQHLEKNKDNAGKGDES